MTFKAKIHKPVTAAKAMAAIPQKRDRTSENFAKAAYRLIRRCDQLHRRYGADCYVLVHRKCGYYDYNSSNDATFPSLVDLVCIT